MKSTLAYRYTYTETLSAVIALRESLEGKHLDNPFIVALMVHLKKIEEKLRQSIAYHDQNSLAEESDSVDIEFNEAFKKVRTFVEMYSEMEEFGVIAESCAEIKDVIHRHGRNLHTKPKDEQIALFDSVLQEVSPETIAAAGVEVILQPAMEKHNKLKEIEKARHSAAAVGEKVDPPSEISKQAKPLIASLHNHLQDFAHLGDEGYITTLTEVNAKLTPIVTRVKARKTRSEHPAN